MGYPHSRDKAGVIRLEKQGSQHFWLVGNTPRHDYLKYGTVIAEKESERVIQGDNFFVPNENRIQNSECFVGGQCWISRPPDISGQQERKRRGLLIQT